MKRRFIFLFAFALMALLTPLGAKGQQQLTIRQVRQLAGTFTPVSFTGTVTYVKNAGTATIYLQESNSADGGIVVYYQGTTPSIGDIVTVQANRVDLGNDHISILSNDVNSITVVGHNDTPVTRNVQLQSLKNAHYPATPERIKNDSWQHTLVRLTNLTVVNHLQNSYFNGYVVEDQSGVRDTISFYGIDSEPELPVGASLRSVTAVNCRESIGYGGYMKLFVRSANDIEFDTRFIHYARTHLDQTHVVDGVVNHVYLFSSSLWCVYIEDATGGMQLNFSTNPNLTIGDGIRVQVNPETYGTSTIRSKAENTCILQRFGTETITPMSTSVAMLYNKAEGTMPQWYSDNYESRIMQLTDLTVTDRELGVISGSAYLKVTLVKGGNNSQPIITYIYDHDISIEVMNEMFNKLPIGTNITHITGRLWYCPTEHGNVPIMNYRMEDDIEIATPHDINLSMYPSQLDESMFTATLSQSGGTPITEAYPGQRVYLHLSTTTPDNPSTINYLKASNANYSKLMHHSMRCTSYSGLQLTRMNSTCWSFTMPDEDVEMEAIFTPSPNFDAICSDVWEAREGARQSLNESAKLAYLLCRVTCFSGVNYYVEDARNANTDGNLLKNNNAILVSPEYNISHSVSIGDLVYVQGYPSGIYEGNRIFLTDAVLLNNAGHSDIDNPYVTDLAGLYDDLLVDGRNQYNSRLQDRMVLLSDIQVGSYIGSYYEFDKYEVAQTVNDVTKSAILYATEEIGILEGRTLKAKVLNCTEHSDGEPALLLRSINDIPGINEITFGTNRVEFDEFGGTVSVPLYIGANLEGTPELSTYDSDLSFTATMNNDHTAINITVPSSNSTDDLLGLITVTVGDVDNTMAVFQSGCAPAEFALNPSYMVYGADDTQAHTLTVRNIKHVNMNLSNYVSVEVEEIENIMGTSWITLGNWNEETHSFTFTLSENTGTDARGVKIVVTMLGTDGTTSTQEATLWQNPPAAAMSLDPAEWTMGETPLCVPVTQTITVYYENAFDQTGFNNYHADYVWLDLWNLGSDFYSDIVVEPEAIPVDDSGFGTATFTLTYTPRTTGYHDGTLCARIGQYDLENHEGIPGGAASPWIWASASSSNPFFGWAKLTSMEGVESMGMTQYMLVPMDNTEQGENINFYIPASEPGYYCIQMTTDYLTWDGNSLSQEYFDPWMDWPESRFLWAISFDGSGNAIISPMDEPSYYLSWNNDDEYYTYFECVTESGNPVQIYKLNDGNLPEPTISAESEWFMDGDMLEVTLTPAEGTSMYYTTDGTEPGDDNSGTCQIYEPVTLTLMETTTIRAKSGTCSTPGSEISHTYYKLSNIADVRAAADDENTYYIKGVVTYRENDRSLCFLQDETAGIQTSFATTVYAFENGCEVILRGTPVDNDGYITLDDAQYEITLSSDNVVEPVTVTYSELASGNYQARLVKVENVTVGAHGSGYYPLTQGSTTLYLRDEYEGPYPFTLSEGQVVDVTAVYAHNAEYIDFLIRDDDDDIFVKENHNVNLVACTNAELNQYESEWDSNIRFCDAEGNLLGDNNSYRTGSRVYFTFVDGFGVGCDAFGTPIIAVAFNGAAHFGLQPHFDYHMVIRHFEGEDAVGDAVELVDFHVEVDVGVAIDLTSVCVGNGNEGSTEGVAAHTETVHKG
ncbi:MAG: chitobiase/beta-hexosaminidase C-terminal domain-containing protein, partial [Bacteroidales bacterium]|nr:chitobiase/beta-hexosaminidase C-terminal domain-containing protein [Bacteroidales bacterium]